MPDILTLFILIRIINPLKSMNASIGYTAQLTVSEDDPQSPENAVDAIKDCAIPRLAAVKHHLSKYLSRRIAKAVSHSATPSTDIAIAAFASARAVAIAVSAPGPLQATAFLLMKNATGTANHLFAIYCYYASANSKVLTRAS